MEDVSRFARLNRKVVVYLGWTLVLPGSGLWRSGARRLSTAVLIGVPVSVFLVDRGHRSAKVAAVALLGLLAVDFALGLYIVVRRHHLPEDTRFDSFRSAGAVLAVCIVVGLLLEPHVPPIAPLEVREAIAARWAAFMKHKDGGACDPRIEPCVAQPDPIPIDDGQW